jgi:hypothetical protein
MAQLSERVKVCGQWRVSHIYDDEEEAVEGLADDKLRDEYRASAEIDGWLDVKYGCLRVL